MNEQQPTSPRNRLRELLSIPERQRTDAEWDELNELEIALASVNRTEAREPGPRRSAPPPVANQSKSGGAAAGKRPARKFQKRPPKGSAP